MNVPMLDLKTQYAAIREEIAQAVGALLCSLTAATRAGGARE